jgi:regulatory protein
VSRSRSEAPPAGAFDAALRLLTLRAHSELELRQKLGRRQFPKDEIDSAVERARQLGYVDDAEFARALAAHRARTRGPALIAAELASKGIDRDAAREALATVHRDELVAAARRLAARDAGADRRVVMARLLRRGFPGEIVREVVGPRVERDDEPD